MDITADVIQSFRTWDLGGSYFSDTTKYPDSLVQYALCEGDAETGGRGWGAYQDDCHNFKRKGMFYYAAAWLYSNYQNGITGALNGEARLNVASKSVGDESLSYRVPSIMEVGNDWLTWSVFGQQFFRLRKRAGMGARAV
jgi:hypothetical protein